MIRTPWQDPVPAPGPQVSLLPSAELRLQAAPPEAPMAYHVMIISWARPPGKLSTGSRGLSVAPGTEAPARALWADMACRLSVALCPPGQVCLLTRAVSTCVTGDGSRRMRPPWAGVWAARAAAQIHLPSTRPPRKSA